MTANYLQGLNTFEINNIDRIRLDNPIDRGEIEKAIWGMKLGKVPGIDGLPVEFYRFFWKHINEDSYRKPCYMLAKMDLYQNTKSWVNFINGKTQQRFTGNQKLEAVKST